jgi:hypothetical protein
LPKTPNGLSDYKSETVGFGIANPEQRMECFFSVLAFFCQKRHLTIFSCLFKNYNPNDMKPKHKKPLAPPVKKLVTEADAIAEEMHAILQSMNSGLKELKEETIQKLAADLKK